MSSRKRPSDTLIATMVAFLTPLFLGGPTGNADPGLARAQAAELVQDFSDRSAWELFAAARVVSLGMAAMASTEMSLRDDLPAVLALRCWSVAGALHRTATRMEDRLARAPAGSGRAGRGQSAAEPPAQAAPQAPALAAPALAARALAAPALAAPALAAADLQRQLDPTRAAADASDGQKAGVEDLPAATSNRDVIPEATAAAPTASEDEIPADPDLVVRLCPEPVTATAAHHPLAVAPSAGAHPRQGGQLAGDQRAGDQLAWATSINTVLSEMVRDMPRIPASARKAQLARIEALRAATDNLLAGKTIAGAARGSVSPLALMTPPTPPGALPPGVLPPGSMPPRPNVGPA
ncbi:hypothetical protein [Rhodopila sp.]|uniref:hypothetical protein n=1 Tax=Rhodopila sp. TaxID=2480087 RepID=UPI002C078583|nr:hypothetical protein [Rhodopila sp.]HVZ07570.1 hypothetical protein [Rhodopila sp.]